MSVIGNITRLEERLTTKFSIEERIQMWIELQTNITLTYLEIKNKNIQVEADLIRETLRVNTFLTRLHLVETNIRYIEICLIAEGIKANKYLVELNLRRNKIDDDGILKL